MRKLRFSEDQIVAILRQPELGGTVEEVCRKAGISRQTFYRWRLRYGGLLPAEIKRIRSLEDENIRLRKVVALLSLNDEPLQMALRSISKRLFGADRLFVHSDQDGQAIHEDLEPEQALSFAPRPAQARSGAPR